MSSRDADFSPKTKKLIAGRAGYRCSYPGCDESTIGPGAGSEDVENKGVAAHIYAASTGERAPRGTGGLSAEERSHPANGIWMCKDHSDIVDIEKGKNYAAAELQAWKALQETRIARELHKVAIGQGHWVEKITLETNPLFKKGTSLILGKVTLVIGQNNLGKSAFCEWVSGCAGNFIDLTRWSRDTRESEIWIRMNLIVPERVEFSMRFNGRELQSEFDGRQALDISHCTRVIYQTGRLRRNQYEDDLEYLARVWRVDQFHVANVIEQITSSIYGSIEEAELASEDNEGLDEDEVEVVPLEIRKTRRGRDAQELQVKFKGWQSRITFAALSGGEQDQFIISGAMVIANLTSLNTGALLLLDFGSNLDDQSLSEYAERLQSSDFCFQTILVAHSPRPKVDWTGWSVARLTGVNPNVEIEQKSLEVEMTDP